MNTLQALSDFARALHVTGINTERVQVTLPPDQWQLLADALRKDPGFAGIQATPPDYLTIMGIRYLVRFDA